MNTGQYSILVIYSKEFLYVFKFRTHNYKNKMHALQYIVTYYNLYYYCLTVVGNGVFTVNMPYFSQIHLFDIYIL